MAWKYTSSAFTVLNSPFALGLGTAHFGSKVSAKAALRIVEQFVDLGGRLFDTATNYPITGKPQHSMASVRILASVLRELEVSGCQVIVKAGAVGNDGGSRNNLTPAFLRGEYEACESLFPNQTVTPSIHWDNRSDQEAIRETADLLKSYLQRRRNVGLSGLAHPEIYADALGTYGAEVLYQVRFNALDTSTLATTHEKFGPARYLAYGLSGSPQERRVSNNQFREMCSQAVGRSFADATTHELKKALLELGLKMCFAEPRISGALIAVSHPDQLADIAAVFAMIGYD